MGSDLPTANLDMVICREKLPDVLLPILLNQN